MINLINCSKLDKTSFDIIPLERTFNNGTKTRKTKS